MVARLISSARNSLKSILTRKKVEEDPLVLQEQAEALADAHRIRRDLEGKLIIEEVACRTINGNINLL